MRSRVDSAARRSARSSARLSALGHAHGAGERLRDLRIVGEDLLHALRSERLQLLQKISEVRTRSARLNVLKHILKLVLGLDPRAVVVLGEIEIAFVVCA